MSLSDHPNHTSDVTLLRKAHDDLWHSLQHIPSDEALKLRMAKKASPTGKTFLVSDLLYIALAWIKKRCCFTSQYPSRWISKYRPYSCSIYFSG
ncbi:hypothetical protein GMA19_01012 [Paenibacillus polymyxa E681]|nr:hypothetical protein GE561_01013 [Paenibacillus polymyxa E681]QNV60696.1 hypothetical protein GMA19_01012 [Paenibacillus polymyxa E681]